VADLANKLRITLTIITIVGLLVASLVLLVFIDRIVNSTLYNYGLQYDSAWASNYQIYFDAAAILIAISIFGVILMAVLNLFEKKEKEPNGLLASPKVTVEKSASVDESELSASTKVTELNNETGEKEKSEFLEYPEITIEKDNSVKKSEPATFRDSELFQKTEEKESNDFLDSKKVPLKKNLSVKKSEVSASTPTDSEPPKATEKNELTGFWATQKLPGVFCRYCGFENEFDAEFCQKCGKSLAKKKKPSASATDKPAL
jgi:hypothetical protein